MSIQKSSVSQCILKYEICKKSFRKDEPLTSWTLFQHICPYFWVGLLLHPANQNQKWGQICLKSVQLVRGSSFRNGLLQNPYFRRTVFSSPSVLSSFAWGIIGRFWHLKCEAPHFLRLQALMTRHWFYNIDQWLAHTVFSRRRSIFGFQFFFLPRIILTGKRHHLENRPMPRNKMNWHLALPDLPCTVEFVVLDLGQEPVCCYILV